MTTSTGSSPTDPISLDEDESHVKTNNMMKSQFENNEDDNRAGKRQSSQNNGKIAGNAKPPRSVEGVRCSRRIGYEDECEP